MENETEINKDNEKSDKEVILVKRKKLKLKEETKKFVKLCTEKIQRCAHFIWKDLRKPHLFWVKIIFLLQSASLVILYPYLTIHMRSLGFNLENTAVVNSALPLADIFGPPLAGLFADKIGNFKVFLGIATFLNGASSLALLWVPRVKNNLSEERFCCHFDNETSIFNCDKFLDINFNFNITCNRGEEDLNLSFTNDTVNECGTECLLRKVTQPLDNWALSFGSYISIRIVLDVLRASSIMMFEGAVMAIIKEHGGDYGLQKMFGTFGAVVFSPLAGKLIDVMSDDKEEDYSGIIILYFIIRTLTALLILKVSLEFKTPAKRVLKDLQKVLFRFNVISYLVAFTLAGILWGFLETFLFWYLEDLGSTKFLMGISLAIGTLAGLPVTIGSKLLIGKLGHNFIIVFALSLYSIRLIGYSLIEQAPYALIFEVLKPFCTTLVIISAMTFIKDISPMATVTTVEGIFGSLYFGVGRGLGGLIGAYSWEFFGPRRSFQIFAVVSVSCALLHSLVNFFHMRQKTREYNLNIIGDKSNIDQKI